MTALPIEQPEAELRVVLAFNEAFNRHDVPGMMELMSDDCVFENTSPAPDGTRYEGRAAVTQFWHDFFRDSPRAQIEIEEIFGFGSRCIMRWRYTWIDSTGNAGHVRGVDVFHVQRGLISEKLSYVKG
jgi:predicted SnoaL-like aldol condensation-catalyzing enzyme